MLGLVIRTNSSNRFLVMRNKNGSWSFPITNEVGNDRGVSENLLSDLHYGGHLEMFPLGKTSNVKWIDVRVTHEFMPSQDHIWCDEDDLPVPMSRSSRLIYERIMRKTHRALMESDDVHTVGIPSPLFLTTAEYQKIVNRGNKNHSSSSYDLTMSDLDYVKKSQYPILVEKINVHGIDFEVRREDREIQYMITDQNGEYLRDENGALIPYSREDIISMGWPQFEYSFAIFNDEDEAVATFGDEWGAVLVVVAREYRGFGLGPLIARVGREMYPMKSSGGFTPQGSANFKTMHADMVRRAIQSGFYEEAIQDGRISMDRVKEIVNSIKPQSEKKQLNLDTKSSKDWLLFRPSPNTIGVYSKALRDIIEHDYEAPLLDRALKGYAHLEERNGKNVIRGYGDSNILSVLVRSLAHGVDGPIYLANDFPVEKLKNISTQDMGIEMNGLHKITKIDPIDTTAMSDVEKQWRKDFDPYDEFYYRLWEELSSKMDNQ